MSVCVQLCDTHALSLSLCGVCVCPSQIPSSAPSCIQTFFSSSSFPISFIIGTLFFLSSFLFPRLRGGRIVGVDLDVSVWVYAYAVTYSIL